MNLAVQVMVCTTTSTFMYNISTCLPWRNENEELGLNL